MRTAALDDPELQLQRDELHGMNVCLLIVGIIGVVIMLVPFVLIAVVTGQLFPRRHGRRFGSAQACVLGPVTEHHRPSRPNPFNTPSMPAELLEINNEGPK